MTSTALRIVGIMVSIIFLVMCTILFLVYVISSEAPLVRSVASKLPAARVGSETITIGDVSANTIAARQFYENQDFASSGVRIDFTTQDGKKRLKVIEREVLNNLIEKEVIENLAREQGISITQADVTRELEQGLEGGQDVGRAQAIARAKLYGWSLDEFGTRIIQPALYKERLEALYDQGNKASPEMQADMSGALAMIADGRSFEDAAREYSQGASAKEGGARGFFLRGQLDPEIENVVFALDIGAMSEPLETRTGLHLFQVDDVQEDVNGVREQVSLSHIYLPKKVFARYVGEALAQRRVRIFLPDYRWNEQERYAVFADAQMVAYQNEVYQRVLGELEQEAQAQNAVSVQEQDAESADDQLLEEDVDQVQQ